MSSCTPILLTITLLCIYNTTVLGIPSTYTTLHHLILTNVYRLYHSIYIYIYRSTTVRIYSQISITQH